MSPRPRLSALIVSALGVIGVGAWVAAQGTPSPCPGLTAQQTRQAVDIARESSVELRKKTEGAARPDVDRREYVVGVELLATKEPESDALPRLKSCSFLGYAGLSPTTLAPQGSVRAQRGDCSPRVVSLFSEEPHWVNSNDLVGALGAMPASMSKIQAGLRPG